jgi:hypothetical protein
MQLDPKSAPPTIGKQDNIERVFKSEPSRIFAGEFTLHPPLQSPTRLSVHRYNGFI